MIISDTQTEKRRGFALVELMVAIGIIVILSVSLLFQQSKFDSTVQITNVAYEIMTVIKQAQVYSTSSVVGDSEEETSHGVYFREGSNEFIFYRNTDSDRGYGESDEEIEIYTIPGKTTVSDICSTSSSGCGKNHVSISFMRPDPEPDFKFNSGSGTVARIVIENDGEEREIVVSKTGQIEVNTI